jgi:two-component system phosphate regulon response regulator PhoB
MATVLVVDDEPIVREVVVRYLERDGHDTVEAGDGNAARRLIESADPDIVVLDVMLPGTDGLELCRWIRGRSDLPVIMLTARGEEADRIVGLELGADDYVTKPFSPSELVARCRAVLRRALPQTETEVLQYQDLSMDLATHRVRRGQKDVHLGPTEFRLLRFLLENQGRVFSREQLLDHVWGRDIYVEPRTVDVHIRRLRKAINIEDAADLVRTVRSAGYALDVNI